MEKNKNGKGDVECWYVHAIFNKGAAKEGLIDKVMWAKE